MNRKDKSIWVGIDLGTTNSVLAYAQESPGGRVSSNVLGVDRFQKAYNSQIGGMTKYTKTRNDLLPSFVYYHNNKNSIQEPIVGDYAKMMYATRPYLVSKSIKSQMGSSRVNNDLGPEVPDKRPEQISARILTHLLTEASKMLRTQIKDVIITVPASFDPAMCAATLEAAYLSGIKTKNSDGSARPILLAEPDAVIYDMINQIQNGAIPSSVLDLEKPRNVIVFDIGGGTLDVTMSKIERSKEDPETVDLTPIAISRYMRIGGDDFDRVIAEAMFERLLDQYKESGTIIDGLLQAKKDIMPTLVGFAEDLKMRVDFENEDDEESGVWGSFSNYEVGGPLPNGYTYEDTFEREDIENILSPLLGANLVFEDYKNLDSKHIYEDNWNIIFPILDVLNKASKSMKTNDVIVDKVVINGGMSRFGLVKRRLRSFFGFTGTDDLIEISDPDRSVAKGAAFYHYLMSRHENLSKQVMTTGIEDATVVDTPVRYVTNESLARRKQNESVYLAVKGGVFEMLIEQGTDLPYESKVIEGYRLEANQQIIKVPIYLKGSKYKEYDKIASGEIEFDNTYPKGAFVNIQFTLSPNKTLSFNAWTIDPSDPTRQIEKGQVKIRFDGTEPTQGNKHKLAPKFGTSLNVNNELNSMLQIARKIDERSKKNNAASIKVHQMKLTEKVESILRCGNSKDFAHPIVKNLKNHNYVTYIQRLLTIARKLGKDWDDDSIREIIAFSKDWLQREKSGTIRPYMRQVSVETILFLGTYGEGQDLDILKFLHLIPELRGGLIEAHARSRTQLEWLWETVEHSLVRRDTPLSSDLWAIGVALRRDLPQIETIDIEEVFGTILEEFFIGNMTNICQAQAVFALSLIGDQRYTENQSLNREKALEAKERLVDYASDNQDKIEHNSVLKKALAIADNLLYGEQLSEEDERYLLGKINDYN